MSLISFALSAWTLFSVLDPPFVLNFWSSVRDTSEGDGFDCWESFHWRESYVRWDTSEKEGFDWRECFD